MPRLSQRGAIHLIVPIILLLGIVLGVYLVLEGPKIFNPKASVSGPIGGVTYVDTKIGCGNPQGLTPDQICQQKGFVGAVAVDYQTAAKGYWWRQCGGASVSNCDRLNCKVNELDCTNTSGYWGSQQPYPENFTKAGTSSTVYKPADFDIQTCSGYSPGWTMRVACSLSGGISGPITPSPSPTPSPTLSPSPSPISGSRRVFVTSTTYNGNLGGLAGADAKCQEKANAANLGGTWKAWLSDSTTSAASRLEHAAVPYRLINGAVIANDWTDLTDNSLIKPINVTETGGSVAEGWVWTATNPNGSIPGDLTPSQFTCGNWLTNISSSTGVIGVRGLSNYRWSWDGGVNCSTSAALYCFEQPAPSPSPSPVACTLNDLRAAFFARRGEPRYNAACDINNDGRISVTDYSALLRNLRR